MFSLRMSPALERSWKRRRVGRSVEVVGRSVEVRCIG
jgi:hypothetical protein